MKNQGIFQLSRVLAVIIKCEPNGSVEMLKMNLLVNFKLVSSPSQLVELTIVRAEFCVFLANTRTLAGSCVSGFETERAATAVKKVRSSSGHCRLLPPAHAIFTLPPPAHAIFTLPPPAHAILTLPPPAHAILTLPPSAHAILTLPLPAHAIFDFECFRSPFPRLHRVISCGNLSNYVFVFMVVTATM